MTDFISFDIRWNPRGFTTGDLVELENLLRRNGMDPDVRTERRFDRLDPSHDMHGWSFEDIPTEIVGGVRYALETFPWKNDTPLFWERRSHTTGIV